MGHSASIKRIKEFEDMARPLEPEAIQRLALSRAAIDYAEDFLERLVDKPAYKHPDDNLSGLYRYPIGEQPHAAGRQHGRPLPRLRPSR